jgi:hypothetical protein
MMMTFELRYLSVGKLRRYAEVVPFVTPNAEGIAAAQQLIGVLPAILNQTTGKLLTPKAQFAHLPDTTEIPILIGQWDAAVEDYAAVILSGGVDHLLMSRPTDAALMNILFDVSFEHVPALGIDLDYLQAYLETFKPGETVQRRRSVVKPDATDAWDIPMLDINVQPTSVDPFVKWGTISRDTSITGLTVHFYTDDYKFKTLLENAQRIIDLRPNSAVEMNITLDDKQPRAYVLWRIFQKRSAALIWQRAGIPVFVDMNVPRELFDLNMLGVPDGWRAYANRAYTPDMYHLDLAYQVAMQRSGGDVLYVVYGGGTAVRAMCEKRGWHWIPEDVAVKRGRHGAKGSSRQSQVLP